MPSTVNIPSHSWQYGLNFDPAAALWRQSSTGYALLAANDDDALSDGLQPVCSRHWNC